MISGPGFRLARAAVFAAVCVVTTALGHALMSDDTLPAWAVGYAFCATTAGAWWLTGKERGALAVTGATIATQFVLHAGFILADLLSSAADRGSTWAAGIPMASMPGMAGPWMGDAHNTTHFVVAPAMPAGMMLAHTLAALVCGLWMWRGEKAVFRLGRALAARVVAPLRRARGALAHPGLGLAARRRVLAVSPAHGPCQTLLYDVVIRRGPPGLPVYR